MPLSRFSAASRLADPHERRLWRREATRPLREGGGPGLTLRAPVRPARGHGETYAVLCRRLPGGLPWPVALCLAEAALIARA